MQDLAISFCRSAKYLSDKINLKENEIPMQVTDFADGEMLIRYGESLRGKDVFIVQSFGSDPNKDLVELLLASDTAFAASARRITLVLPLMYGSRQDRKSGPRTTVTTATVAKLFRSVEANRIITASLHSPQSSAAFYAAGIRFDNLSTANIFLPAMKKSFGKENFVVVSPDVGGIQKARFYAKELGADIAFADKRRYGPNRAELINLVGEVSGKDCFIVDDMIDTGGSLMQVVNKLVEEKANNICCLATHLILSKDAEFTINNSPISYVLGTDSVYHKRVPYKFKIFSIGNLLQETIVRINENRSVGDLYENHRV